LSLVTCCKETFPTLSIRGESLVKKISRRVRPFEVDYVALAYIKVVGRVRILEVDVDDVFVSSNKLSGKV